MATRQIKMPEKSEDQLEPEQFSQRKRPEIGRYLLQVDRQTKGSYQTAEAATSAGRVIKESHPVVHVTIYDSVDGVNTTVAGLIA